MRRRSAREQMLIIAFIVAAGVVWLRAAVVRIARQSRAHHSLAVDAGIQRDWLARKPGIEERARRAAASLDPRRTLDATHLVAEVSALAGSAGLAPAMEPPRSQTTGQFAYHTVPVAFHGAELPALVKFYRALAARAPYLAIEECTLAAGRRDPAELDAQFVVFSIEILR
ncbi:MAG TPA: hypothetical protein VL200_00035 [Lacunisphaera sp.]|nr:hypothetical protein [Lacunisphaera sp.]